MQYPRLAHTRSRVVQPGRGTALDALVDLACVEGWVLVVMPHPERLGRGFPLVSGLLQ